MEYKTIKELSKEELRILSMRVGRYLQGLITESEFDEELDKLFKK